MRATRAYITSFGTTGLLIASALLMLSVMSAFVAFNGFPGQDVQDPIGTLLLQEPQAAVSVPARPVHGHALGSRGADAGPAVRHRAAARRGHTPTAGTGPVRDGTGVTVPGRTQAPASAPQSSSISPTSTVSPQVPGGGTPSLPDTNLPPAPSITVPQVSLPPPQQTQLPIDTSGVTGILNGG